MDKMPSLSTIKRTTRTLNQLLGTSYSPTQIYRNEVEARKYGKTTRDFQTVVNLPRTRSDVKTKPDAEALKNYGEEFLKINYAELADKSPFVLQTLNAQEGDFFSTKGELIQKVGDGWLVTPINAGARGAANRQAKPYRVKELPPGAVPSTPQAKEKIIKTYAKQIAKANKLRPGSGYDGILAEEDIF